MSDRFNVPMLGLAAGLMAPSQGGSFGGALGNGLRNYSGLASQRAQREAMKERAEYLRKRGIAEQEKIDLEIATAERKAKAEYDLKQARKGYGGLATSPVEQAREAARGGPAITQGTLDQAFDQKQQQTRQGLGLAGVGSTTGGDRTGPGVGSVLNAPGMRQAPQQQVPQQDPRSMLEQWVAIHKDATMNGDKATADQAIEAMKQLAPVALADKQQLVNPLGGNLIAENEASATPQTALQQQNMQSEIANRNSQIGNRLIGPDGQVNQDVMAGKRAGATQIVNNTGEKSILNQVGGLMKAERAKLAGAVKIADSSARMIKSLDSGSVIAGPWAGTRRKALQIAGMLGYTGADGTKSLAETRKVIRELAVAAVESRKQLAGQGTVTDSEAAAVEKTTSGDIDDLTVDEIRTIANMNIRAAHLARESYAPMMEQLPEKARPFFNVNGMDKLPPIPGMTNRNDGTTATGTIGPSNGGFSIRKLD